MSEIKNIKVSELINLGNCKITYQNVSEGSYGTQARLLLKKENSTEDIVYGVTTTAKQIIKMLESNDLKGAVVRFKKYEIENTYGGFTTFKMFIQHMPKAEAIPNEVKE